MAVLAMVRLAGDPEQLLAAKREYMDPVAQQVFRRHGHREQLVVRSDEALLVFNLWENAEGRDRANADPSMQEARQKIIEATGATAEFANWTVVEQKTTQP